MTSLGSSRGTPALPSGPESCHPVPKGRSRNVPQAAAHEFFVSPVPGEVPDRRREGRRTCVREDEVPQMRIRHRCSVCGARRVPDAAAAPARGCAPCLGSAFGRSPSSGSGACSEAGSRSKASSAGSASTTRSRGSGHSRCRILRTPPRRRRKTFESAASRSRRIDVSTLHPRQRGDK